MPYPRISDTEACPDCEMGRRRLMPHPRIRDTEACPDCEGRGRIRDRDSVVGWMLCGRCGGNGGIFRWNGPRSSTPTFALDVGVFAVADLVRRIGELEARVKALEDSD